MSVAVLANAIVTALGFPSGDRIGSTVSLANALAAARGGTPNQLNSLVTRAESMRDSDGQFVNTCSDSLNRPTPTGCANWWWPGAKLYPQFGTVGALNLVKCLNWPSGNAPRDPKNLKVNVLLLGVQNDPIAGTQGCRPPGDRHQRRRGQQAGDVAGHRARRQHLLGVRAAADDRLPRQRQPAAHRHLLPA